MRADQGNHAVINEAAINAGIPRARWYRVGLLLLVCYLFAYIDRTNIGIATPAMIDSLGISSTAMGVLQSAFFWGYVVGLAPAGWIAMRFGPKRVLVLALAIFGIAAAATGLVADYQSLLVTRFFVGLGEGFVWPAFGVLFVRWFTGRERARAIAFSLLALPLSSILAAPLGGWMIDTWNYHVMFVLQGLPPLLLVLAVWRWLNDEPTGDRWLSERERHHILDNRAGDERPDGRLRDVFGSIQVWTCGLVYFLWLVGLYSFSLWLPTVVKELSGSGMTAVGWLSAVPFAVAAVVMYLNSRWADRVVENRTPFVVVPLALAGLALLAQHYLDIGLAGKVVFLLLTAIGLFAAFGPWFAWVLSIVPRNMAAPATALVTFCGNFGGVVGPVVVGAAAGNAPVEQALYVLGYFLLAAGLIALVLGRAAARTSTDSAIDTAKA
jgi:MFS family permease